MINNFAIVLSEMLMLIATWRLLKRPDLDAEDTSAKRRWPRA